MMLLPDRALRLADTVAQMEIELGQIGGKMFGEMSGPEQEWPAPLLGQKIPPILVAEDAYHLAPLKAEFAFVDDPVRGIIEEGCGPVGLWREMQATDQGECRRANEAATHVADSRAGAG